jgi:hypothetical protein
MDAVELIPGSLSGDRLLDRFEAVTEMTPFAVEASGARSYSEVSLEDVETALDRVDGEWRRYLSLMLP